MVTHRGQLIKRVLIAIALVVVALVGAAAWYVNDYYHADDTALAVVADENGAADGVTVCELASGALAFVPDEPVAGLVFYPGAKVQPEAYAPLMQQLAERDILCVLVKPLFNLAILDMDAADGIAAQFPTVERWIVAGHSMGGVAAADYASRHGGEVDDVVFLASYPSVDLSAFDGSALSFVGSEDKVLNHDNYERAQSSMPSFAREVIIEGGNHAYYGNYGEQAGDGVALITRNAQQAQVVASVVDLVNVSSDVS